MDGNGKPIDGSDGLCCAATVTGNAANRSTDARIRIVHRLATGIAAGTVSPIVPQPRRLRPVLPISPQIWRIPPGK